MIVEPERGQYVVSCDSLACDGQLDIEYQGCAINGVENRVIEQGWRYVHVTDDDRVSGRELPPDGCLLFCPACAADLQAFAAAERER